MYDSNAALVSRLFLVLALIAMGSVSEQKNHGRLMFLPLKMVEAIIKAVEHSFITLIWNIYLRAVAHVLS